MLIVHRKEGQTLKIGDNVTIIVIEGRARIGIDAPLHVPIWRGELLEREERREPKAVE